MAWVDQFSDTSVRAISTFEVLAAVGLILSGALHIAPVLVPLAATGVAALQIGALITNVRYGEANRIPVKVILIALALFVTWVDSARIRSDVSTRGVGGVPCQIIRLSPPSTTTVWPVR